MQRQKFFSGKEVNGKKVFQMMKQEDLQVSSMLDFMASLEFFGIKLGLDQTRYLAHEAGDRHKNLKFIHVAGSNGKGSVCAMLEAALRNAGYKTGFFSSPHLVTPAERYRINSVPVSDELLAKYIAELKPAVAKAEKAGMRITYFEFSTVLAAMMFADANTDFVLWETGMGGRLDSTNIVTPVLSAITGISMEHADRLGDTIEKIAFEKAGIIKKSKRVFVSPCTPENAVKVISERAKELSSPLTLAPLLSALDEPKGFPPMQMLETGDGYKFTLPLAGPHQRANASLVVSILDFLAEEYSFSLEKAIDGIGKTFWPARFQFVAEKNLIIDAAHNPEGVQALFSALTDAMPKEKFKFIFGAFADKDVLPSLKMLSPIAESFTFVHMNTERKSVSCDDLEKMLENVSPRTAHKSATLEEALMLCSSEEKTPTVLCGSLHLCGDAISLLLKQGVKIPLY